MLDLQVFLLIIFVLVVLGVFFYTTVQRAKDLRAFAQSKGLQYEAEGGAEILEKCSAFESMNIGRRRLKNIIRGNSFGIPFHYFDYVSTTGYGKNKNTFHLTVFFVETKKNLCKFRLSPENLFHKLGDVIGFQDIDFDSNPEFSKSYRLVGENEVAIRDLFTFDVLHYFENHKGWTVEGKGHYLIIYKFGTVIPVKKSESTLKQCSEIARHMTK